MKKTAIKIILILTAVSCAAVLFVAAINIYVCTNEKDNIVELEEIEKESFECVVVLGAGVKNGQPSLMLKDRLDKAVEIYLNCGGCTVLLSGNGRNNNLDDEISVMKAYMLEKGVSQKDIVCDEEGYSTYETVYRTKYVYGYNSAVFVTQRYHLYRTLFSAEKLGITVKGTAAEDVRYFGQTTRDIREVAARVKDFFMAEMNLKV